MIRVTFDIVDMRCASCAMHIKKALLKVDGVFFVDVNPSLKQASIKHIGTLKDEQLIEAIESAGYKASILPEKRESAPSFKKNFISSIGEETKKHFRLFASCFFSIPLILGMFLPLSHSRNEWLFFNIFQAIFCFAVLLISGTPLYQKAFNALKTGRGNMALLLSFGVSLAFFSSLFKLYYASTPIHLHFETAATILTLVTFGDYLENKVKNRATLAFHSLTQSQPTQAERISGDSIVFVKTTLLQTGDRIRVRPGSIIPCDGIIDSGQSEINESLVTGESLPVLKKKGEEVLTGTINGDGVLEITVKKVGDNTRLAQIVRFVQEAQSGKAAIQRLADKISEIFCPSILLLGFATFFFWFFVFGDWSSGLECMIAVLVVSCPCALSLATPMALVAGSGAAAKAGILIRDVRVPEQAQNIRIMAFDKTGTLTFGKPIVESIFSETEDKNTILLLAAALAEQSEHPLSKALIEHAKNLNLSVPKASQVQALPGLGICGIVSSKKVLLGNKNLAYNSGVSESSIKALLSHSSVSGTCSFVLINGILSAVIGFSDTIRPEAFCVISTLSDAGIDSVILTGDNESAASKIAKQANIHEMYTNLSPEEKVKYIKDFSKKGKVVFVGDGLNDAPALAAADLGVAFSSGVDAAHEAASIVLMRSDLRLIPAVFDALGQIRRTIKQNLAWAFSYNLIAIPLAVCDLFPPTFASGAMVLSSLFVAGNSFLLSYWEPKIDSE